MKIICSTPEKCGIHPDAIPMFIHNINSREIPLYSFILYRNNRLVSEIYLPPCTQNSLHEMCSITKSFVSLGIGILADKGAIHLDDHIIKYFNEYISTTPHPWLSSLTIRHMLNMQSCHSSTTYKKNSAQDWVKSFFTTPPDRKPGTGFSYDTSSTHTLCALVEKISSMPLLDFLRQEFLNSIDFSRESYIKKDPFGVSIGGSGLMAKSIDILKLGILIMNNGIYNNKQLLPQWYLKEAVSSQVSTINQSYTDERQGYGYQFWRFSHNGYGCYGMGGQFLLCYPHHNLICVTTTSPTNPKGTHQLILNSIYEHIFPYISN